MRLTLWQIPGSRIGQIFLVSIVCLIVVSAQPSNTKSISAKNQLAAEEIWDRVIEAKGGRAALHRVSSVQGSSSSTSRTNLGDAYPLTSVFLAVLPHKVWTCEDARPSVFGVTSLMLNYEDMTSYFALPGRENKTVALTQLQRSRRDYQNTTILYLTESRWLKPRIVAAREDIVDRIPGYIVETDVDGRRVDFFVDRTTYLPNRIDFHNVGPDAIVHTSKAILSDYKVVDGVKVPHRLSFEGSSPASETIRFNVDYDPEIFVKPPSKITPDSWKKSQGKGGRPSLL